MTDESPQYRVAHIRRALAEDPRTTEMGVRVNVRGDQVHLSGEVATEQRRAELEQVLTEIAPEMSVSNVVRVADTREPGRREELR
jgi:osmotically-inducible protein OsmY